MTGDQQWPTYNPDDPDGDASTSPADEVIDAEIVEAEAGPEADPSTWLPDNTPPVSPPYGTSQELEPASLPKQRRRGGRGPAGILLAGAIGVVGIGGISVGIAALADRDGVPGIGSPEALTDEGLEQIAADVQDLRGDTVVFQAVIYPKYASVYLPVDGKTQRYESRYWDGDFDDAGSKGTSTYKRFDLADIEPGVIEDAIETAKSLVEDPNTWYVVIYASLASEGQKQEDPEISAHAGNEYGESGYVDVTFDGTEVRRYENGEVVEPEKEN